MKLIKYIFLFVLFASFSTPAFTQSAKVYVVLFMHNEDGTFGDIENPEVRNNYLRHRQYLIEMSEYLHENNVSFAWQSDWKFLELALMYENTELIAETNGKNIVRWMKEDMNIAIDAHSHEHFGYNYADVACLLDSLGVQPTQIIGGHIWDPYITTYADWERFRQPLQGTKYPHYYWQANVLMGSGTPNHTYDPSPSGIWRPKDKYHYWQDDPDGKILCVGQYTGDLAGVGALVKISQNGSVPPSDILTCSIHTPQGFSPNFMNDFSQNLIEPLLSMRERGEVELVDYSELIDIWENEFTAQAHLYNPLTNYVPEQFDLWIPGESAGTKGVFVRISVPNTPRFLDGKAPVVIHSSGGWDGKGISDKTHGLDDQGFIELDFNFPGSGLPNSQSGGFYDHRGEHCIQSLRDVTRFALGIIPDNSGYFLADMLGDIVPDQTNTGLCGWSNGGNATITAAGAFGDEVPGLAWIVNWESPVGDGMPNVDAGGHSKINPAYNPNNGEFDESLLSYSPGFESKEGYSGAFYFDLNENGILNPALDFIASYQFYNEKYYYSDWLREAAEILKINYPDHIATLEETADFWRYRNGEFWIEQAVQKNPDLMFIVEAGDKDHVQAAPDHPHVLIQYMGFLNAGARFVRLNPDQYYVEQVLGVDVPGLADNDGMISYDHQSIRNAVQPRNIPILSGEKSTVAAVCELADRSRENNTDPQIDGTTGSNENSWQTSLESVLSCYPNPFTHAINFSFVLDKPGMVLLEIYNTRGQLIMALVNKGLNSGAHQISWDGNTKTGQVIGSGLFYYRFISPNGNFSGQIIRIK